MNLKWDDLFGAVLLEGSKERVHLEAPVGAVPRPCTRILLGRNVISPLSICYQR
jgi:hypothetical protein